MAAIQLPITELYSGYSDGGYDLGYSPGGNRGIQYSGKHFLFLRQGGEYTGDFKIHILKSTDAGATWSDVANFDAGQVPSIATCQDGNLAWIIYTDSKFTGDSHCFTPLRARSFDMNTDSLSGVVATGPTPEKLWHSSSSYVSSGRVGIAIATRSSGSMLAIYPSAPSGDENRLSFVTFNGSSFGSPVAIGGTSGEYYIVSSALVDSDGVWHAIIDRITVSTGARSLLHLPVDAGGTSAPAQVIVTGLDGPTGGLGPPQPVGQLITFNGGSGEKIAFPNAEDGKIYIADAGDTGPSWSTVSFSPSPPPEYTSTIGWCMASSLLPTSTGLMVFWTTFGTSPDYDVRDKLGKIYTRSAAYGALGTWSAAAIAMQSDDFAASTTMAYSGPDGGGVYGGFVQDDPATRGEDRWWYGVAGGPPPPAVEYPNEFD